MLLVMVPGEPNSARGFTDPEFARLWATGRHVILEGTWIPK
jgi:hypothetical protein